MAIPTSLPLKRAFVAGAAALALGLGAAGIVGSRRARSQGGPGAAAGGTACSKAAAPAGERKRCRRRGANPPARRAG
jgi:hypothetical protein